MNYHVLHETRYDYASPVALSHQLLHLTPRPLPWQAVHSHRITLEPAPAEEAERKDDFGNLIRQVLIATPHQQLAVQAESKVSVNSREKDVKAAPSSRWETARDRLGNFRELPLEPAQFLYESPHVPCLPELAHYAAATFKP